MSSTDVSNFPSFLELSRAWEDAITQFFSMMLDEKVKLLSERDLRKDNPEKPVVVGSGDASRGARVVSAVGMAGDMEGVAYYDLPESLAIYVTSKMMSLETSECGHEFVNDALGELANMATGSFKNQFVARGLECRLTIPSLIRGSCFSIEAASAVDCYHYTFQVSEQVFDLYLTIKPA
ncbi:MAG: chemotaxis protein CheX [Opitutales bacterium]